jgi:predicted phage terminase large subunit-like protein
MDFPATQDAVKAMTSKHKGAYRKLVEEKANGAAIMDSLRHEVGGFIPVLPDRSKAARLNGVAPMFEAGNVYIPDPSIAPWVHDYVEELVKFPNAANDDQVDMTTQALDDLRVGHGDLIPNSGQNRKTTLMPTRKESSW